MGASPIAQELAPISLDFGLEPFAEALQPLIDKAHYRKGTLLIPRLLVWLVLALTLRRDKNYTQVLNWLLSGFRWLGEHFPDRAQLVSEGAISHARQRLGPEVFATLLQLQGAALPAPEPDFHGYRSAAFDGTTGTVPDTPKNTATFGKPAARRDTAAFPQIRLMALLALSVRQVKGLAWAPYRGKGTGERALLRALLPALPAGAWLYLLDAGLYAFDVLWRLAQGASAVLIKVPKNVRFTQLKPLGDGSYWTQVQGRVPDPTQATGYREETLTLRLIRVEWRGFRPYWLATTLLDTTITPLELARHYHRRWVIELTYDEIKTHQCVTLRGQSPTTFRSRLPDLVEQELYALAIMYNVIRQLMVDAAQLAQVAPGELSFVGCLEQILEAAPFLTAQPAAHAARRQQLLTLLAQYRIEPRKYLRRNPRVVKVKMSKWPRKRAHHQAETYDMTQDLRIIQDEIEV
jgi:hypothetical protein